jgi:hypothetical protein
MLIYLPKLNVSLKEGFLSGIFTLGLTSCDALWFGKQVSFLSEESAVAISGVSMEHWRKC